MSTEAEPCTCRCEDQDVSYTSTIAYEQEPFDTFQHKVRQLATARFGLRSINTERMKGGSFNRVVGITVGAPEPKKWSLAWFFSVLRRFPLPALLFSYLSKFLPFKADNEGIMKYILRSQRFESMSIYSPAHDIAVLQFARARLNAPIAEVIACGLNSENAIGSPYTIQERLPGENLQDVWNNLSQAQRLSMMRQIVDLTSKMQSITNSSCGVIAPRNDIKSVKDLELDNLKSDFRPMDVPLSPAQPQTTVEHLLSLCDEQILDQKNNKFCNYVMPCWYKMRKIILALHDKGFLPNNEQTCQQSS
ncbi:hypothetical protein CC80DRAFT_552046 [Byssothecium circinans]|uniref:Aminoglycoside phosphotransferase domain-containing protein n=1 Tax=Byssothecium circinans TaxID=147558 RepID=A0A6A5TIW7_9PLEO|nr:hypothetical protein CC80DRAFT_552046 [Byssothecium circinans]